MYEEPKGGPWGRNVGSKGERSKKQSSEIGDGARADTAELLAGCFGRRILRAREAAIEPPSCEGIMSQRTPLNDSALLRSGSGSSKRAQQ